MRATPFPTKRRVSSSKFFAAPFRIFPSMSANKLTLSPALRFVGAPTTPGAKTCAPLSTAAPHSEPMITRLPSGTTVVPREELTSSECSTTTSSKSAGTITFVCFEGFLFCSFCLFWRWEKTMAHCTCAIIQSFTLSKNSTRALTNSSLLLTIRLTLSTVNLGGVCNHSARSFSAMSNPAWHAMSRVISDER
jgi:hypothetical protein